MCRDRRDTPDPDRQVEMKVVRIGTVSIERSKVKFSHCSCGDKSWSSENREGEVGVSCGHKNPKIGVLSTKEVRFTEEPTANIRKGTEF